MLLTLIGWGMLILFVVAGLVGMCEEQGDYERRHPPKD